MAFKRRNFLLFLGASAGTVALSSFPKGKKSSMPFTNLASVASPSGSGLSFKSVKGFIPLPTDGIELTKQLQDYSKYEVKDDLVLPEGVTYDIVAAWGDKVGDSRFGYNNDYLSFIETGNDEGLLTVNHEYISAKPWIQTYKQVVGKSLPFEEMEAAVKPAGKDGINAFALPDNDPIQASILEISKERLIDLGLSVISIRRNAHGKWVRTNSKADRRITAIQHPGEVNGVRKEVGGYEDRRSSCKLAAYQLTRIGSAKKPMTPQASCRCYSGGRMPNQSLQLN